MRECVLSDFSIFFAPIPCNHVINFVRIFIRYKYAWIDEKIILDLLRGQWYLRNNKSCSRNAMEIGFQSIAVWVRVYYLTLRSFNFHEIIEYKTLRTHSLFARKIIEHSSMIYYFQRLVCAFLCIFSGWNMIYCEVNTVATCHFKMNICFFLVFNSCDMIAMCEFQTTRNREKIWTKKTKANMKRIEWNHHNP